MRCRLDEASAVTNLSGLLWAFHRGDMRKELYEQYKKEHPEELTKINTLFAYNRYVETRRKAARKAKVELIHEWERRLENE